MKNVTAAITRVFAAEGIRVACTQQSAWSYLVFLSAAPLNPPRTQAAIGQLRERLIRSLAAALDVREHEIDFNPGHDGAMVIKLPVKPDESRRVDPVGGQSSEWEWFTG